MNNWLAHKLRRTLSACGRKHFAFFSGLLILLSSCWPASISLRDNSMPDEWRQFYVSPLEMTAATAPSNYGAVLTDDLRSGIQNNTRLKLSPDPESAQVLISGIVTGYATTPIAISEGDQAARTRLTISASFTIITPTKGLEKMTLTSSKFADFDASRSLQDVENQLIGEINQQIVQDVINKLLSNW